MRDETILREAEFNPKVVDYWLLSGLIPLVLLIFTIPIAIIWYFTGRFFCKKYLARMGCTLTDRSLIIRKGLLNRIEKTIPLEKITDLALFQGPIMRYMNLHGFKVETAGSGGATTGYLVQLTGIVDTEAFRDAVLTQRDLREDRAHGSVAQSPADPLPPASDLTQSTEHLELLREIRDSLKAIESQSNAQGR